ncbi:threo-3-hydroxy-L-aspartate ammonia-lyase [Rhodocaloribacter litoris]|uniref:threo-3-hydroxy-L-aspartate ammonia-lyase n=1 Tax=Rhodocaloribacter litoris TaxID=2558931 RepID=UPI00141E2E10|nr:threo-3-hydroxy-L-aspartate ammonia-lyase [Rhodocaloribacter litoris]QXD15229.1 threo-3-hydroxy-L-aspartate ammonia-lyase [Rhodocaloribacter litoris]
MTRHTAAPVHETALPVTYDDVAAAAARLDGVANRTPVMTSRTVDARTGATVFFKCEPFQRAGAFKFRGAYNALARLAPGVRHRGVLTYSSGNHAQALALAGRLLGVPVTVIMPEDAPAIKRAATEGYGARIIPYDRHRTTRETLAAEVAAREALPVIPPYDHPDVIAGQGTAAKELFEATGPLDYLFVPCGGGGLLSGSALAARAHAPGCRVVGVEPEKADDATRSFRTGTLHTVHNPDTIADGARTPSLGQVTFPLVLRCVDEMVTVSDEALLRTMFFLWERMKLVVEPTGALAAAAVLEGVLPVRKARVGVILSGGNVDLGHVLRLYRRAGTLATDVTQ